MEATVKAARLEERILIPGSEREEVDGGSGLA